MRRFSRELVDLERAEQTDDRVRHALGDFGDGAQLGNRSTREPVDLAIHLLEHTARGLDERNDVCSLPLIALQGQPSFERPASGNELDQ
jgi:hypothetical protein